MDDAKRILIIGPSWVGDMIMTQSLFMTLKQLYPNADIDVLAPDWTRPLLERMPEVQDTISIDIDHGVLNWQRRKAIAKKLRARDYSHCIVIPNTLKSALIPFFAKIPQRTGWLKEPRYWLLNDLRKLDKSRYPAMLQRLNALAYPAKTELPEKLPTPRLSVAKESVQEALDKHNLNTDTPILVLCPGAEFGVSKRWPETHYAKLAIEYLANGWQVWLFGSDNDFQVCNTINELVSGAGHNLAGKTTLAEAIDLMSLASLVVSNDSGLMHMAAALDRSLIALYGSTSPDFTPPASENSLVLQIELDCSPCFKRECPLQHHQCMQQLSPEMVITACHNKTVKNSSGKLSAMTLS